MKSTIIKIVLTIIIIYLGFLVIQSIKAPVDFKKERAKREKVVIQKLKDIRSSQLVYRSIHNEFAPTFDTLIDFLKNGKIPIVKMIPDPEDTTYTKTINDTIRWDIVADFLFPDSVIKNRPNFSLNNLLIIPFSEGDTFKLEAGTIIKGNLTVHVFEVSALYNSFMKGMDKQLLFNKIAKMKQLEKFPGLKIGSMTEPSIDGNWEY
ncbi:MAG: hypothetical protein K8R41_07325 [Bacteroidales bacterium]|nr:hypothetical protein [Bacteroidales bacterium]